MASIIDLRPLPSQELRPDTFDPDAEAFFGKLPQYAADIDAARNQAVAAAEAGANGYPFLFDTATAAADPGAGRLRFNNSNVSQATMLYVNATTSSGAGIGALLDTFGDSTSSTKGTLRLVASTDPGRFVILALTAVTSPGPYRAFAVTVKAATNAAPFSANQQTVLQFAPAGDRGTKGDVGNADKVVQIVPAPSGSTHTINYQAGACAVWEPPPGACTLVIANWPAAGTLGEMWIELKNGGLCTITTQPALEYLKPDGSYNATANMNANQGVTLRSAGIDNILLWGRAGAPRYAKVAR